MRPTLAFLMFLVLSARLGAAEEDLRFAEGLSRRLGYHDLALAEWQRLVKSAPNPREREKAARGLLEALGLALPDGSGPLDRRRERIEALLAALEPFLALRKEDPLAWRARSVACQLGYRKIFCLPEGERREAATRMSEQLGRDLSVLSPGSDGYAVLRGWQWEFRLLVATLAPSEEKIKLLPALRQEIDREVWEHPEELASYPLLLVGAAASLAAEDPSRAREQFRTVLALPDRDDTVALRGEALCRWLAWCERGELWQEALEVGASCQAWLAAHPGDPECRRSSLLLARAAWNLQQGKVARDYLAPLLSLPGDSPDLAEVRGLWAKVTAGGGRKPEEVLEGAEALLDKGRAAEALALLRALGGMTPEGEGRRCLALGKAYSRLGLHYEAWHAWARLEKDPDEKRRGLAAREAVATAGALVEDFPGEAFCFQLYQEAGRRLRASYPEGSPGASEVCYYEGRQLEKQGKEEEALASYRRVASGNESFPRSRVALARLLVRRADQAEKPEAGDPAGKDTARAAWEEAEQALQSSGLLYPPGKILTQEAEEAVLLLLGIQQLLGGEARHRTGLAWAERLETEGRGGGATRQGYVRFLRVVFLLDLGKREEAGALVKGWEGSRSAEGAGWQAAAIWLLLPGEKDARQAWAREWLPPYLDLVLAFSLEVPADRLWWGAEYFAGDGTPASRERALRYFEAYWLRASPPGERRWQYLWQTGKLLREQGEAGKALSRWEVFRQALEQEEQGQGDPALLAWLAPRKVELWLEMGRLAGQSREWARCRECLGRALALAPRFSPGWYEGKCLLAEILWEEGTPESRSDSRAVGENLRVFDPERGGATWKVRWAALEKHWGL